MLTGFSAASLGQSIALAPLAWWAAGTLLSCLLGAALLQYSRRRRAAASAHPAASTGPSHQSAARRQTVWHCLGVIAISGVVIAALDHNVSTRGAWARFDDALAAQLASQASDAVLRWFSWVTRFADVEVVSLLAVAVAAALWWNGHRLLAAAWFTALAVNGALTRLLKSLFERVRPEHVHGFAQADGFSFPSGHTSAGLVAYALLGWLATRFIAPRWHLPAVLLGSAIAFTTGYSRAILQVHYASDVAAGWALGAACTFCAVAAVHALERKALHQAAPH